MVYRFFRSEVLYLNLVLLRNIFFFLPSPQQKVIFPIHKARIHDASRVTFDNNQSRVECTIAIVRTFLGAFAKLRKAAVSFVTSACMEQLCPHWMNFYEIWYLSVFRESGYKIKVLSKYENNNWCYKWRTVYICDNIWLTSSWN
jgi:hypothetical protein